MVAYSAALPVAARRDNRPEWAALGLFLIPVSVFQILPDWVLADLLGLLAFPDTGGPRVGDAVPVAMGLMWVIPLFLAVGLAGLRPGRAAALGALIFAGAELFAPLLDLWEPLGDTWQVAGIAVYVIPAEAALAWAVAVAFRATRESRWPLRVAAASGVSTFYLGALTMAHFILDVADWSLSW